ncbi:hypothetical protein [Micromonospora fulviviridis]|uniref:hypothetical protein n=1 Tax=Micromonospora fulviviridis TaxID=47860 RepID=UPI0037A42233
MSRIDEPVDRAFTIEVAALVESAHTTGRGCLYCTPGDCERQAWARPILAEHRQKRAAACLR